jgi:hypothetical protein
MNMRTEIARKLAASTAAGALGVLLLAAPALAQGQSRENRAAPQAGGEMRGGAQGGGGGEMRGRAQGGGGGEMRGGAQVRGGGDVRGSGRTRVDAGTRSNLRAEGNVRTRGDVRVQGRDGNVRNRADVRVRDRVDTNIRTGIRSDQRTAFRDDWRGGNDRWRYRDRGASFSVGVGISDPYYAYGYDDGYGAYAAAEPYAYGGYARRGYGDGYYSYGAASGCTCATPYASWNNTGWGGYRSGFAAW